MSLDKLVDSTQLDNDLTSVADAIRSKGGTSASLAFPSGFVSAIEEISGGGSDFDEDADFCFWDYDGTPLYSYSRAEIQAMTELPAPPDHSQDDIPLTFLYWNWTLSDLKALTGAMDIGACYKPTDGKMHWFYKLTSSDLTCSFTTSYTNDVVINWGDGVEEHWGSQTENGANPTHTYSEPGLYHCTWYGTGRPSSKMRTEGNNCVVGQFIVGDNMTEYWLGTWWGGTNSPTLDDSCVETIITNDVIVGKTRMCTPIPTQCRSLKFYVVNPYDYGNHYYGRNCSVLKGICFAKSWTATNADYTCSNARSLKRVRTASPIGFNRFSFSASQLEFYDGIKLGYKDLENTVTLKRLVIKSTIDSTIFGTTAENIPRLEEIWCGLATPPTLSSSTPFSKLVNWAKIHVPAEAVEDYKTASNWSLHADKIVGDWTADPIK